MAYESMTYETILQGMIDRVAQKYPTVDIREGSIVFDAMASAAIEFAIAYTVVDNAMLESFVKTASREYLYLACDQIGLDTSRFDETAGTHKAVFNVEVPIGSRWNCDLYNYTVTKLLSDEGEHVYEVECETLGSAPNIKTGDLTPISDMPNGFEQGQLVSCLVEGKEESPDDEVRDAYYEYVKNTYGDGNVNQYLKWCSEYDGIGNAKVIPLWNGANTVKVSILSESNTAASDELIAEFQQYLDPNSEGMGNGVAPIGAFVTVSTATELPINVSATITYDAGYSGSVDLSSAISDYLSEIAYKKSVVSYMSIGSALLKVEGVDTVTNLTINGGTTDITLGAEQIPVLGTTDWSEG